MVHNKRFRMEDKVANAWHMLLIAGLLGWRKIRPIGLYRHVMSCS